MGRPLNIDFETLFERSPNPYMVLDRDLRFVRVNDAYLDVTMRERDELIGTKLFDSFPADEGSESYTLLKGSLDRVLETGERDEIALIRYDIERPDGGMEERYWSATHTPLHDADGNVTLILQHTVDVTELHNLRQMRDEAGLMERANAVQSRYLDIAAQAQEMMDLFEQAPGFISVLRGPDHEVVMANATTRRLVGGRELVGQKLAQAIPELPGQGFLDLLDSVLATGEAFVGKRRKVELDTGGTGETEERYIDFVYQPIFAPDGSASGVFVLGHDVTEEVAAADRQKLLIHELNHRVKNTLAIVQGLVSQSFRSVEGAEGALKSFDARLHALSAAHTLLTESNWEKAEMRGIIEASIKATAGANVTRFDLDGPHCILPPQMAVSLAMMVHELSTNAIKHGALSNEMGRISVDWQVEKSNQGDLVQLEWRESGGPPVEQPRQRGFGSRLIQHGMAPERDGSVEVDYDPQGFRCRVTARLPRRGA